MRRVSCVLQGRPGWGEPRIHGLSSRDRYYDVEDEPEARVLIRAVGVKSRNQVRTGIASDRPMRTLELDEATDSLAEYVRDVGSEPVIVTVDGKPIAALVAIENADLETLTLSTHPEFLALIERSRARQNAEGGISPQTIRRRVGL